MSVRVEHIGDATLYLGDCLEILPSLPGRSVSSVVTDPPYGMAFRSNYRQACHSAIANDAEGACFRWACGLQVDHSKYVFCRWDNLGEVPRPKSVVTWVKNNWSMGDLRHEHARQTELIMFWPGPLHFFPKERPQDVVYAPRTDNALHPTEKPVPLMERVVSWTDGLVFDPFMGAGATGVAAAKLGRKFIGIELEPKYFDIACRRIEEAYAQPDMFIEPPAKPVQEAMDL